MTDPLPLQNIEAEESILGGILLDPSALDRILHVLDPHAFYVQAHRQIYQAAIALYRTGQPIDLMTMTSWLTDQGILDQVGGMAKLTQLVAGTVSATNIDRYVNLVMDKYLRRQLSHVATDIFQIAHDTCQDLDQALNQSEKRLFQVSQRRILNRTRSNADVAIEAYEALETDSPIYPTGLYDLDELIVGLEPGTLTILAGRPSMGKSYCAMYLAVMLMLRYHRDVVFFSLEMTARQLEYRLWSLLSVLPDYRHLGLIPVSSNHLRRHRAGLERLDRVDLTSLAQVMGLAAELPLYLNDDRGMTASGMASECRRLMSEGKQLGLVVVDYLQMMAADADAESGNRSYELGDVARDLYKMAGELNAPVVALSQISRAVDGRNNKRPMMSDLSQSGILEMVADNVILAYRDDYYNSHSPDSGVLELIVAKSRHGSTGTAKILFERSYGLLQNMR